MDFTRKADGSLDIEISARRGDGTYLVKRPGSLPGVDELGYAPKGLQELIRQMVPRVKKATVVRDRAKALPIIATLSAGASQDAKDKRKDAIASRLQQIDSTKVALEGWQTQSDDLDALKVIMATAGATEDDFLDIPIVPEPEPEEVV